MALTPVTITYDISDLSGADFDARRTKVWVTTNIADNIVVDTVGNQIRVGDGLGSVASDGTGSVTVWAPGTGSNPASWQTYVHFDYAQRRPQGERVQQTFGPFTVTADANLADLIQEQAIPATYLSEVTGMLQGYVSAAEAAAQTATDLTGIDTPDALVATLVNDVDSDTASALTARFTSIDDDGNLALDGDVILPLPIVAASAGGPLSRFHRQLAADPANTRLAFLGDSKSHVTNAPTVVPATGPIAELIGALRAECQAGGLLAGMNPANIAAFGNNGARLDTFLGQESTGVNPGAIIGNPWSSVVAFAPHLLITGWLTNDFRDNSTGPLTTTAAQGRARLEALLALAFRDLPNTDVILRKSGPYVTTGGSYFVGSRTAAEATALMNETYGAFEGKYPHVSVYDPVRVFGKGVYSTSPLMADILHANTMGYRAEGRDLLRFITPASANVTQLGPKAAYMRLGVVVTASANLLEVRPLTYTTGLGLPIENTAANWIVDSGTGVVYGSLGSRALTAATKQDSSQVGTLRISETGANWSTTVGPVGSIVQLNADGFVTEGATHDGVIVGVQVPVLTAGQTTFLTVTVPGVKVGIGGTPPVIHGVIASPAPQLPAGLMVGTPVTTATNTVKVPVTNATGATVADLGYPLGWNFFIVR